VTLFFVLTGIALVSTFTLASYIRIYQHYRASRRRVAQSSEESSRQGSFRLARTLFITFAVFVTCWAPYVMVVTVDQHDDFPMEVHLYALLLAHLSSSLNAVVYGLTNSAFREGYKIICGRVLARFRGQPATSALPSSSASTRQGVGLHGAIISDGQ
jgi:ABC-type Fe3+ transport system permease subunit